LVGQTVNVGIELDGRLWVYHQDTLVASHILQPAQQGWVTVPEHHTHLWQATLKVQPRPLAVYEEVAKWS
jgi:hypothetical protein